MFLHVQVVTNLIHLLFVYFIVEVCDAYIDNGHIGCCKTKSSKIVYNTSFPNNRGYVCKKYCFEGENRTIYAGTTLDHCYCIDTLNGSCGPKADCHFHCPGHYEDFCGGPNRITVYDAKSTSTRSITTTTSSTSDNISTNVSSASNSRNDGTWLWQYIVLITVSVLVNILVLILILLRRLRMRQIRRKKRKADENPPNTLHCSNIELCENATVASRRNDVGTEYDTTTTSRPNPPSASGVEGDYGRLRISPRQDPTYSHIKLNKQHGACALLETDYSHIGRTMMKSKWTNNEQSDIDVNDYDNVHFNQSCIVQSVKTVPNFGTCNDDIYNKLQYKL